MATAVMEKNRVNVKPLTGLTDPEKKTLHECEETIRHHLGTFREAGSALLKIRDSRLYREHYGSFEAYCRGKWEFSKTQANRLIQAAKVVETLSRVKVTAEAAGHLTESAVRPLAMLTPAQAQKVVQKVSDKVTDPANITARLIAQTAREIAPKAFAKAKKRSVTPATEPQAEAGGDLIRRSELMAELDKWAKAQIKSSSAMALTFEDTIREVKRLIMLI